MIVRFLIKVLKLALILTLPFIVLIKSSIYMHENYNYLPYISLLGGVLITTVLLLFYFLAFYSFFSIKIDKIDRYKKIGFLSFLIVLGYCINALFFISTNNLQSSSLSNEVNDLHPILRVAVSTIIILDKKLIITDASRVPEDYKKMGLKTKRSSLHYKQKDGYAYAIDLHTNSRNDIRNFFLKSYFKLMGFNTLRHGGTGDHLHISLSCKYRKGAI